MERYSCPRPCPILLFLLDFIFGYGHASWHGHVYNSIWTILPDRGWLISSGLTYQREAYVFIKTFIGKKLDLVIYFKTSLAKSVARLGGRRVCKKCNANFHIKNIPPKKEGVCDYCGGALYQRKDDEEGTVRKRWSVYTEETSPLITYYAGKGILREVAGDLDVDELNKILMALFNKERLT